MKSFIGSVLSVVLASSILYGYSTLASNSKKITTLEVKQGCVSEIKQDIIELRKGQREILKILINN